MSEFIPNPLAMEEVKFEAQPAIHVIAEEGANDARNHAAVETGEMRDSIAVEETDEGARIVVGTDHWMFIEFGTSIMAAQPFMRTIIDDLGLHR